MKIFLFMYPYWGYFLEGIEELEPVFKAGLLAEKDLHGINRIIEGRYRNNGYQIVWVFYGKKGALHKPVVVDPSPYLDFRENDTVISSGTQGKHPNCEFIMNLLPEQIESLVVGGFHWQFCPKEVAEFAESLGIPAVVDEDTTQAYLPKLMFHRYYTNETAEFPMEGVPFIPFMGADSLEGQVRLYCTLEECPFLVRDWDREEYSLRDSSGILKLPKAAFHKIFEPGLEAIS